MNTIACFSDFSGADTAARLAAAMAFLREHPGATLTIEPGDYLLTTPLARKTQDECMRGVYGPNPEPTMFSPKFVYSRGMDFAGQRDTTVLAAGARLIVDGFMEPVSLRDCTGVTLEGLTIDHLRKPYSRGRVSNCRGVGEKRASFDVTFGPEYPVYEKTPFGLRNFYYNNENGRLEYEGMPEQCAHMIAPQVFRFEGDGMARNIDGCEYYVWHTYHSRPAILIERAENVTLRDVTIHSQPGMGIVGNRSQDILIERLRVVPGDGGHLSTNTDATHFTACRGALTLRDCTFEGQGDDAINVHGYYHTILSHDGMSCTTAVRAPTGTHAQTLDYPDVGDTMELCRADSLERVGEYRVTAVTPRPDDWESDLALDRPLPEDTEGLLLFDITRLPYLTFEGCASRGHFARSVLCKTRGARIAHNRFEDVMGTAVCIYAESSWQEGTTAADVTVEDNIILRCGHTFGGCGGVEVGIRASKAADAPVIRNIRITGNTIHCPGTDDAIRVHSVDGLTVRGNRCSGQKNAAPVTITGCTHVDTDL